MFRTQNHFPISFKFCVVCPYGFKDPNNRILGPKYYNINGIWALKPIIWVLGPLGLVSTAADSKPVRKESHTWRLLRAHGLCLPGPQK